MQTGRMLQLFAAFINV